MKLSSLFAPLALFSVASTLHAQSAVYLETAPLSFLRAFAITSVVSSTKGPLPIEPGASIPLDPDDLRPDHRITTDIGAPGYYSEASGDQSFWVNQSERAVLERLALQQQKRLQLLLADEIAAIKELEALVDNLEAQIAVATDLNEQTALKNQLAAAEERLSLQKELLGKRSKTLFSSDLQLATLDAQLRYAKSEFDDEGARWELLAVREPQRGVEAAGHAPYRIFLGRIERTSRMITRTFDSGLRIQPYFSIGSTTETLADGGVVSAKSSGAGCTTCFELLFDSDLDAATDLTQIDFKFATDPLHLVAKENLALAEERIDYNTEFTRWNSIGSGYMTYGIRSTPGPVAAVIPVNVRITGHGSWARVTETTDADGITTFSNARGGINPCAIKVGDVKYQHRNLFPDFALGANP